MQHRSVAAGRPTAFADVNVVQVDHERVLQGQTVVVEDGRISAVGELGSVKVPAGASLIDCMGRHYLMPGLADMHVHVWNESDLTLFVANGVTTIRNMWGSRRHLSWKKRIAKGTLFAPAIYTAGPLLDGDPPIWKGSKVIRTAADAKEEVARERRAGYDFVKVYNRLSAETYQSIVASARSHGIEVTGHVPYAVGLAGVLEAKQDCWRPSRIRLSTWTDTSMLFHSVVLQEPSPASGLSAG